MKINRNKFNALRLRILREYNKLFEKCINDEINGQDILDNLKSIIKESKIVPEEQEDNLLLNYILNDKI